MNCASFDMLRSCRAAPLASFGSTMATMPRLCSLADEHTVRVTASGALNKNLGIVTYFDVAESVVMGRNVMTHTLWGRHLHWEEALADVRFEFLLASSSPNAWCCAVVDTCAEVTDSLMHDKMADPDRERHAWVHLLAPLLAVHAQKCGSPPLACDAWESLDNRDTRSCHKEYIACRENLLCGISCIGMSAVQMPESVRTQLYNIRAHLGPNWLHSVGLF